MIGATCNYSFSGANTGCNYSGKLSREKLFEDRQEVSITWSAVKTNHIIGVCGKFLPIPVSEAQSTFFPTAIFGMASIWMTVG